MGMQLTFHPAAESEMTEAALYYESKLPKLGTDFLDEIERYCHLISHRPLLGSEYLYGTRRVLTHRFPYAIIYRMVDDERIEVIAVAHQHRRPGYWRKVR